MALKSSVTEDKTDGRSQRSARSREKIKAAIVELIRAGDYAPRAIDISEHTGLSIRTVFRHIDHMESLFREISEDIQKVVLSKALKPYASVDWREQLEELMARRVEIFEFITPIRISCSLHRFRSEVLNREYELAFELERASLTSILPAEIADDASLVNALNQVLGVSNWISLRVEQGLSPTDAAVIVRRTVRALLASAELGQS